jgi:amicoumacin kinase
MDATPLERACHLYQTSADQLTPLYGGYSNAVYRFPLVQGAVDGASQTSRFGVLRVGVEDCPPEQTQGMLEWVHFLSLQGAPVSAPIRSVRGRLVERLDFEAKKYNITAFEEASGTLAERIPPEEWTDELFSSIGKAVGKLHTLSKQYHPLTPIITLPQWFAGYEIQDAIARLRIVHDPAGEKLASLIQLLRTFPTEPDGFGLIHDDLHFANFLIQADGKVTIIDFDDCQYGWFSMDVAMALFDVLVLYNAPSEKLSQDFARRFMHNYLSGYRLENGLPMYWQEKIPYFLKLKEICVYAPLIGHAEIKVPDSWVGRFMRGRSERITNDLPYVDIDFKSL